MRFGGIIFLLVGIGLLIGTWFPTSTTLDLRANGDRVQGTVVSYTTHTGDDGTTYAPVYAYVVNGTQHQWEESVSSSGRPTIGTTETLLVDPNDPTRVRADTFMSLWFLTLVLGGMGALFTIIGLVVASGIFSNRYAGGTRASVGDLGVPTGADRTSSTSGHAFTSTEHEDQHREEARVEHEHAKRRAEEQREQQRGPFID